MSVCILTLTVQSDTPDFTLPAKLLATKAYVRQSMVNPFDRMIVEQDQLASVAERQRKIDIHEGQARTREIFGAQVSKSEGSHACRRIIGSYDREFRWPAGTALDLRTRARPSTHARRPPTPSLTQLLELDYSREGMQDPPGRHPPARGCKTHLVAILLTQLTLPPSLSPSRSWPR
jgi:hypothetical protein